jgi:hypothetical protein
MRTPWYGSGRSRRLHWFLVCILLIVATSCDGNRYPDDIRSSFMTACEAELGATRAECECALQAVEKQLSRDELADQEISLRSGRQLPDGLSRSVRECKQ